MRKNVGNTKAARLLLANYGIDSLSYFSLNDKKKFFFSSTGESFLSYIIRGKVALVSGDPIGPPEDIATLLEEFAYFAKGAKLMICFLGVSKEALPDLQRKGHKTLHIGNEAIIALPRFKKSFLKKKVRRAEKHIIKLGIVCRIYKINKIPNHYYNQLNAISTEWLEFKGGKEKGYSMTLGRIPKSPDSDCEIVLALKNNDVLGYLTLVPVYASKSLSLDAVRKKNNTPNGLTEFLFLQAFEYFQIQGIETVSLNFATFNCTKTILSKNPKVLMKSIIFTLLSRLYKTHQLYNFNCKFMPVWKERYITFEKKRFFPYYLLAIASLEA